MYKKIILLAVIAGVLNLAVNDSFAVTRTCTLAVNREKQTLNRNSSSLRSFQNQLNSAINRVTQSQIRTLNSIVALQAKEEAAKATRDWSTGTCLASVLLGLSCFTTPQGQRVCATSLTQCASIAARLSMTLAQLTAQRQARQRSGEAQTKAYAAQVTRYTNSVNTLTATVAAEQATLDADSAKCDASNAIQDCVDSNVRSCEIAARTDCQKAKPYSTCITNGNKKCIADANVTCHA